MSDLHVEAFHASSANSEDDSDLLWKEALIEGEFVHPQHRDRKFKVVPTGASDASSGVISMEGLIKAHDDQAYDQVQVPLAEKAGADHEDYARVNTGFVKKLRMSKRSDGKHVLETGIKFTEPDIREKVERGTINNGSSGIYFNVDKGDGRHYDAAMRHYALTNTNWIPGLKPFVQLSDDDEPDDYVEIDLAESGETVWNPRESLDTLRNDVAVALRALNDAQNPLGIADPNGKAFWLRDLSSKKALVTEESEGKDFVVPFKRSKDGVSLEDPSEWIEAEQEWVAASEDTIFARWRKLQLSENVTHSSTDDNEDEPDNSDKTESKVETSATNAQVAQPFTAERYESSPDTPEARLAAAQKKRKTALLASEVNNRGGTEMADGLALESLGLSDEARTAVEEHLRKEREKREALLSENQTLKRKDKEAEADAFVTQLSEAGLEENSGFLKLVRRVMLSDDGEPAAVLLSEDGSGNKESVTATDLIKSFVAALPRDTEGKLRLSEQALREEAGDRPANDTEGEQELPQHEETKAVRGLLKLPDPVATAGGVS